MDLSQLNIPVSGWSWPGNQARRDKLSPDRPGEITSTSGGTPPAPPARRSRLAVVSAPPLRQPASRPHPAAANVSHGDEPVLPSPFRVAVQVHVPDRGGCFLTSRKSSPAGCVR